MNEHPRARLARSLGLALAYSRDGDHGPEFLKPGMQPTKAGRWTIYSFSIDPTPTLSPSFFAWGGDGADDSAACFGVPPLYR